MGQRKQLEERDGKLVADLPPGTEMLQDVIRRKYVACSEAFKPAGEVRSECGFDLQGL